MERNYDHDESLSEVIDSLYERLERQERILYFLLDKLRPLKAEDEILFFDLLSGHSKRNVFFETEEQKEEESEG